MSDINQETIRALISSNESISESVKANSEIVKELVVSVQELVTTERERVLKDEYQKEINTKQNKINEANDIRWTASHDTLVRAKRFHATFDSVSTKVIGLLVIGVLVLLGFNI